MDQRIPGQSPGVTPVSVHFVNNVLAAAASYIEEDPEAAREVLAELGAFLSHRLRGPRTVSPAEELDHIGVYLRLDPAHLAVGSYYADVRGRGGPTVREHVSVRDLGRLAIVGMDELQVGPRQPLRLGEAQELEARRVVAMEAPVRPAHEQRVAHELEEPLIAIGVLMGAHPRRHSRE